MKSLRSISIICLFLGAASLVRAEGLVFGSERVVVKATPDQDVVRAEFSFTNKGKGEAIVLSVVSGCQCLEADAPEGPIPAGAEGKVVGFFKIGAYQGLIEKQMAARVRDDNGERDILLTVAVEVPTVIVVEPGTLTWDVGAAPNPKEFTLKITWPEKVNLKSIECSREEFVLTSRVIEDGKEYRITVTPKTTAQPLLGLVQFRTDSRFEKYRDPMAFVHIKAQP
ncbi:MAG: DUF1573 domain-containing protein [Verrucomicrobiales bacterium]